MNLNEHIPPYHLPLLFLAGLLNLHCNAQVSNNRPEKERLILASQIVLPNVSGRLDHLAFDPAGHLAFIAALGNGSIEIVNIITGKIIHSITGLHEPQGVAYISGLNRLAVANGGNGDCLFFDAPGFAQSGAIHLKNDADNVRYDASSQLLYVGYGNGAIAVIDPHTMKLVADIRLDAHPESFQISKSQNRMYINVPDANEMEVIELSSNKVIEKRENKATSSNFPLALDDQHNRLFIGFRGPATLAMVHAATGQPISMIPCSRDADDIFYNLPDSLVFVSSGEGFVDLFRAGKVGLLPINHIKTRSGARTSFLLKDEKKFLLAVPARGGNPAALWIYNLN